MASAKAHAAASKALELDPTIAEGHAELGLVEFYYDWDWPRSEQEFQRAIELNPNYATAHQWYGYYLAAMGRFPEALEEARKAQQMDPLSLSINTTLAGRYRDLIKMLRPSTSTGELWKWTPPSCPPSCPRTLQWGRVRRPGKLVAGGQRVPEGS